MTGFGASPWGGSPWGGSPMGGSPWGGSPWGGSPMGVSPWGGSPWGGSPMGGSPWGGSPWGGSPMGGLPWGGYPLATNPWGASPWSGNPWSNQWGNRAPLAATPWGSRYAGYQPRPYPVRYPGRYPGGYPRAFPGNNRLWANPMLASSQPFPGGAQCMSGVCSPDKAKKALEGVWKNESGETLVIKDNRFEWSDSSERRLSGDMHATTRDLVAKVDDYDKEIRYRYRVENDKLTTRDDKGVVRVFRREDKNDSDTKNADRQKSSPQIFTTTSLTSPESIL